MRRGERSEAEGRRIMAKEKGGKDHRSCGERRDITFYSW
jgi:hypothetical protein